MYFLSNSLLLILLLAPPEPGHGAPSNGEQLAAGEDEEINESEDFLNVFKDDQLKTEQELDRDTPTLSPGVPDEQTVDNGRDFHNATEKLDTTVEVDPSSPTSLDQSSEVDGGSIPTTTEVEQKELSTENEEDEAADIKNSSQAFTTDGVVSKESDEVEGLNTIAISAKPEPEIEASIGATSKSSENEPEGLKETESVTSEPSTELEVSTNPKTTVSGSLSFADNSNLLDTEPSGNDDNSEPENDASDLENDGSDLENEDSEPMNDGSNPENDDSEPKNDGSEPNNNNSDPDNDNSEPLVTGSDNTNTGDYLQAIDQFQNQDFSKETIPSTTQSTAWGSTLSEEGSPYLNDESSEDDFGSQVEDQQQQQQEEEQETGGGEEVESRSLLSRWWLWLIMLCLGLGLGLLCKARMNANQGEAEYLRMGERHQGSTITIPR